MKCDNETYMPRALTRHGQIGGYVDDRLVRCDLEAGHSGHHQCGDEVWMGPESLTAQSLEDWRQRMNEPSAMKERVERLAQSALMGKDRLLRRVIDEYWAAAGVHPAKVWMRGGDPFLGVSWECGVGDLPPGRPGEVYVLGDDFPQVYARVRASEAQELAGSDPGRLMLMLTESDGN
jgi:hypothetical protein